MPLPRLLGLIESTSYFQVNFFRDRAVSVVHPVVTIGYIIGVKMAEA
jgi:hypothetical protein